MGKQSIYLNDKIEDEIRAIAQKEKRAVSDVICTILAQSFETERQTEDLKKIEDKIEAIYMLVDLIVSEIGYVIGATRASTKSIETISREGEAYVSYLQRISAALKMNFNDIDQFENQKRLLLGGLKEE